MLAIIHQWSCVGLCFTSGMKFCLVLGLACSIYTLCSWAILSAVELLRLLLFLYHQLFTEHINKRDVVKKTKAHIVLRLLRFFHLCFHFLFLSWGSSSGGGRTPGWCHFSTGSGQAGPALLMRLPMLTVAKAFACKPGQKRSLMKALIWSSVTGHLVVEGKGQAEAADLVQTYDLVSTSGAMLALRCYEGLTTRQP